MLLSGQNHRDVMADRRILAVVEADRIIFLPFPGKSSPPRAACSVKTASAATLISSCAWLCYSEERYVVAIDLHTATGATKVDPVFSEQSRSA